MLNDKTATGNITNNNPIGINNNTKTYTNDSDIVCYRFYCGGIGLRCDDTNSGILTVNIHTANQIFIPKSKFGEGFSKLFIYHIYLI